MKYSHTQKSPLDDLLFAVASAAVVCAWAFRHEAAVLWLLIGVALFFVFVALSFVRLTVRDEGDCLAIRFGVLPVFRKRIPYSAIEAVEPGRSSFIDGLGIHYVPGRGWTYNLWGTGCVTLTVTGKTIRIGTDDVEHLTAFLRSKVGAGLRPPS